MAFDYMHAANSLFLNVQADDQTMDGTVFCTAVDSNAYAGYKALTFIANVATAVAYSAVSWVVQESNDGTTYTAVDADSLYFPKPADLTTTSKAFHIGYTGKARYVKAAFNSGASGPTGQLTAELSMPLDAPVFASAITGIEG